MKFNSAVDFETFYFHHLLERIIKKSRNTLGESLQQSLQNFIDFLSANVSPLDNIEKLAHLQGTSDLSIFFSDLIERINEMNPEQAVDDMENYADDFLEIYNELARDQQWQKNIYQELLGEPAGEPVSAEPEVETTIPEISDRIDFKTFISTELKNRIMKQLEEQNSPALDEIEPLFDYFAELETGASPLEKYQEIISLSPLVEVLGSLTTYPGEQDYLEKYITDFNGNITRLCEMIDQQYRENAEDFRAFIRGEVPVMQTETSEEMSVQEEIPDLDSGEQPRITVDTGPELSEEDKNLRWLLRDYIIHEIEELSREISSQFENLPQKPSDKEAQSIILDNIKVLKDLGQIHKYPKIESASLEIHKYLKNIFIEDTAITDPAVESIEKVLSEFTHYIDAVLKGEESEVTALIDNELKELSVPEGPVFSVEEEIAFQDKTEISTVFADVNGRYIRHIEKILNSYLKNPDDASLREALLSDISHLRYWYKLMKLSGAENVLEVLANWIQNPDKMEKLRTKYPEIGQTLQALNQKLTETSFEEWNHYLEILTISQSKPLPVTGDKAIKAFVDVTGRQLIAVINRLDNRETSPQLVIEEHLLPLFRQIADNSWMINNLSLQEFCQQTQEIFYSLTTEEEDKAALIRQGLVTALQELHEAVSKMPSPMPLPHIKDQLETLLSDLRQGNKVEEKLPPEEDEEKPEMMEEALETEDSQEMDDAFYSETKKYLEELEETVESLNDDLQNTDLLAKIGDTFHTIKGSAQMLEKSDISKLAGSLESLTEKIQENKVKILKQYISLCRRAVKALNKIIDDKKVDIRKLINSINNYLKKYTIEPDSDESAKKKSGVSISETPVEEIPSTTETEESAQPDESVETEESAEAVDQPETEETSKSEGSLKEDAEDTSTEPLLRLKEEDPELLEIFRNETKDNLDSIENNLNLIEKFRYDKQTLQVLDHAVHEIRSAAKMLGFVEIGQIVDYLEELIELIGKKDPENWRDIIPTFRKSIVIIRELSNKQEVSQVEYDAVADAISNAVLQLKGEQQGLPPADTVSEEHLDAGDDNTAQMMRQSFIQEAREYLEDMNYVLMKLEKTPQDNQLTDQLMRTLHTLKGSSSMMKQEELEQLTHIAEDYIQIRMESEEKLQPQDFELLFKAIDEVEFIINALESDEKKTTSQYEELLSQLGAEPDIPAETPEEQEAEPSAESASEEETVDYSPLSGKTEGDRKKPEHAQLRIDTQKIDSLLNEAAELVINNNQLKNQIDRYKAYLPKLDMEGKNLQAVLWQLEKIQKEQDRLLSLMQPGLENMKEVEDFRSGYTKDIQSIIENLDKVQSNFSQAFQGLKDSGKVYEEQLHKISSLSNQIHDEIMHARLIPIGMLFSRFQRPLRDMAAKSGKKINLFLEGESTEIDRFIAEELYDPILHILRNAVDHGIEPSDVREKSGKSEEGIIRISASRERNNVLITLEDDGHGINVDRIKERLREKGILKPDEINGLTTHELFEYLTYPGFSTLKEAGKISGRGVGLDVVRNQIQKLKGDLRISSQPGKMSRFTIRVPISITVTQAMLVIIEDNTYAVPLLQVEETLNIAAEQLESRDEGYFMQFRGGEIPVLQMSRLLKIAGKEISSVAKDTVYPVIIVQDEGRKVGLLVDKIIQREEILIRNIGDILQRTRYIMGGSIMADGKVVLVLDIPQIVFGNVRYQETEDKTEPAKPARTRTERPSDRTIQGRQSLPRKKIEGRKPLVLIVDDSLSVRKFLSGVLGKHNIEVDTARNGQTALEMISQKDYDLMITDLEMPQVSGYELIEQIRSQSLWDNLPIIVLTGRASKHIQQHSFKLGANEFIIKPFKDKDLLEKIAKYVDYN